MEGQDNLKHKYIKVEVEAKIEALVKEIIRIGIGQIVGQIVQTEDNSGRTEVDTDLSTVIEKIILEKNQEIMADKIAEENTETTIIEMTDIKIGLGKACFPGAMTIIELGV